jgi:hypothetical protein
MASILVDASMPRPTAALIASYGHAATDVRDIGMATASDPRIAAHAQANGLSLLSRDQDFANVLDYPPDQYQGIVVIEAPRHGSRAVVLALVEQLLQQKAVRDQLPAALWLLNRAAFDAGRPSDFKPPTICWKQRNWRAGRAQAPIPGAAGQGPGPHWLPPQLRAGDAGQARGVNGQCDRCRRSADGTMPGTASAKKLVMTPQTGVHLLYCIGKSGRDDSHTEPE